MPRSKLGPRATGPYYCAARSKYRIFIYQDSGPKADVLWFDNELEAREGIRQATAQLTQSANRRLADVLDEYLTEKERRGQAKAQTCADQRACLSRFLSEHLERDIGSMTPQRAAALYDAVVSEPTKKTGKPAAVATHRFYLELAKGFFAWIVRKGYLTKNPFKDVHPIGRASTGKLQLRLDEAKRYLDAALRLFDERNDRMALAAVVPLYLGLRAGEVLGRRVRDVDGGGSVLWIDKGKSKNARRHLIVKAPPLRERLARLVSGRDPEEAAFSVDKDGKPPGRQTLHTAVKRVCAAAGVPMVCPHSLRGLWATLSIESGAAENAVAVALGHGSFEMTAKHYAQPEAVSAARSARVLDLLIGEEQEPETLDGMTAEELAAKLPPGMLAKLLALAQAQPAQSPAPAAQKARKSVAV